MQRLLALALLCGCAAGDIDDRAQVDAIVGVTPGECPARADCAARVCGPDPICGISCGTCGETAACVDGRCACVPACEGRTCRPDGCGGICPGCPAGEGCRNGACVPLDACPDAAACGERVCGPDPVCQTDCGACPAGELCEAGACVPAPEGCPDIADCAGRACGPEPICGTTCGACPDGECLDGECVANPCGERLCGPDGMGGECGVCPGGGTCTDGRCGCVPDCAARICGSDGCDGTCGACPDGVECQDGACACAPRWAAPIAGLVRGVVEHGPHVVAFGQADGAAHVWVFDLCGAPVNDGPIALPGATASMLTIAHPLGADLLVGGPLGVGQGAADIDAAIARVSLPDLAIRWTRPIDTGPAQTNLLDVASDAQGELWFSGSQGFYPTITARLGLIGADGTWCQWPPFASETSATHEVAASPDGATIYVSAIDAPNARIERFSADCLVGAQCACVPDAPLDLPGVMGNAFAALSGLEIGAEAAYVAVYWFVNGFQEMHAEVRRVPLNGGEQTLFVWNPTATFDFLYDLILVPGDGVRVAAARGFSVMGQPPGEALILAFDAALGEPVEHVVGPGLLVDLALGRGAIYAVRTVDQQSVVHRCDPSGACAP